MSGQRVDVRRPTSDAQHSFNLDRCKASRVGRRCCAVIDTMRDMIRVGWLFGAYEMQHDRRRVQCAQALRLAFSP